MATILVVDDSVMDRRMAGNLLEKKLSVTVTYAENGRAALAAIETQMPELVITDLQMPEMNGLELVERIHSDYPALPVILMTAFGSEEIANAALKKGAASYVPKRKLQDDLAETARDVLGVIEAGRQQQRVVDCLMQTESQFLLDNDAELIPPLIGHLEAGLVRMGVCGPAELVRVGVALREALLNAMEHGNLEADSALREGESEAYHRLVEERRRATPYRDRRVHVAVKESRDEAVYVIRDEGPGFDPTTLPDPTDPANLEKVSGRGLLLIRTFMDEVRHDEGGRQITMVKRRDTPDN